MKRRPMFFFAPDDGGGEGGAGGEENRGMAAVNDSIETTTKETTTTTEEKGTPTTTTVDADALAKKFGDILGEHLKPREEPAKKVDQLTPEEAEKVLNVWKPSKEWETKFDNLETRQEALKELRDGLIKHADTISQYRLRERESELDKRYKPALDFIQQYQNEQAEKRFADTYPQLADKKMSPLVKAVADDLASKGKKFDDEGSLFKALAEGVEAVIKVSNPSFKLTAGSNPASTTNKGKSNNSIPVTTPGASGGTGGKPQEAGQKSRGLSVFEPVGK